LVPEVYWEFQWHIAKARYAASYLSHKAADQAEHLLVVSTEVEEQRRSLLEVFPGERECGPHLLLYSLDEPVKSFSLGFREVDQR
jgi:hypothetical protein